MSHFELDRFVVAQDADRTFDRALDELRAGRKRTHWMWFVFPQLAGLGRSATARHFAIASADEARAYLAHDVLGPRLRQSAAVAVDAPAASAVELLGDTDAVKLRSSATLFARVATAPADFDAVLARFFGAAPDPATLRLLEQ